MLLLLFLTCVFLYVCVFLCERESYLYACSLLFVCVIAPCQEVQLEEDAR